MFDFLLLLILNVVGIYFLGKWILIIESIILFILLIWLWVKKYRPVIDNVSVFTGAPGTGKTKLMTDLAIQKYKSELFKSKFRNVFIKFFNLFRKNKKSLSEIPILYSNYPIKLGRNKFSRKLTLDIVLVQKRVPYRSVFAITEFSSIAHAQDFKNEFAKVNVDEWIRFIRQYTKGGWLFTDDQASDLIMAVIRRRIGKVYNMQSFRKIPLLKIGIVNIRHLSISEDIKVMEDGQAESLSNTNWMPVFFYRKTYDTYAFSGRVKEMEIDYSEEYKGFKTNELMQIPYTTKKGSNIPTKTVKTDD